MGKFRLILVAAVCLLTVGTIGLAAERSDAQVFFASDDTVAQYFPQFGNGGGNNGAGFTSSIVLTNTSATSTADAVGTLYFFDETGEPLLVGLADHHDHEASQTGRLFPQAGHLVSAVGFSIPPLGSVTITTDGMGDIVIGSAKVVSNIPVSGIIRFQIPGIGIAGFGTAEALTHAIAPVRRNEWINTALAIRNNWGVPAVVTLEMRGEDGQLLGEDAVIQVEIPGNGRIAQFINELFLGLDTSDVVGSVVIWMDEDADEATFSAIALELGDPIQPGLFTSLPVAPVIHP